MVALGVEQSEPQAEWAPIGTRAGAREAALTPRPRSLVIGQREAMC